MLEVKHPRDSFPEDYVGVDFKLDINERDYRNNHDLRSEMFWVSPKSMDCLNAMILARINAECYAFITGFLNGKKINGGKLMLKEPIEIFKRKYGLTEQLFPYETAKKRYYRSVKAEKESNNEFKGLVFRLEKKFGDKCPAKVV